ncbi:retrotransposon hot spot (RHS) protein [Trypanosoma conorhini]|uniref:Retrotransposon hot spot (RHS) protein n=1 Tax=Trypanosoma conorhini TaxID=83891 RepID=A0A422NQR1_9TRYP|nr:retrotransposon hot spot (RHS) protein [Trypanosoma conorhini]RNF07837.1 retrotransposon hot spot (RHS) protein [Trypanosoma conorhini]
MSGRSEETYAAAESPATNVPRGQRRARSGPASDSQQPPARRRRQEGAAPLPPRWTRHSMVRELLLAGAGHTTEIKLNDFLRRELGGRGVVEANGNVSLKSFVARPGAFITNENDLRLILASPSYTAIKEELEDENKLREDGNKLVDHGVCVLWEWGEFEQKDIVSDAVREKLDAALDAAEEAERKKREEEAAAQRALYESVYNARWSHVVEVPGGDGLGMEVREGKPRQWWEFELGGHTLLPADAAAQFAPPRPRLMVLSSERGWPFSWRRKEFLPDCYVTAEVERVWQFVKADLTGLFSSGESRSGPRNRVLLGMPGIGKSMAAGSYLLYQLLHHDAEELGAVAYFVADRAFLFDKTAQTVARFEDQQRALGAMGQLSGRGIKGYAIYDLAKEGKIPYSSPWTLFVLSAPYEENYKSWKKQKGAFDFVMNCPDEGDVKAMCAWRERGRPAQEQAEHWGRVRDFIAHVGPIPRLLFREGDYKSRWELVERTVECFTPADYLGYFRETIDGVWHTQHPLQPLAKAVRLVSELGFDGFQNVPVSPVVRGKILVRVAKTMRSPGGFESLMRNPVGGLPAFLEAYGACAFMYWGFVWRMHDKLSELRPPTGREPVPCVLHVDPQMLPTDAVALLPKLFHPAKVDAKYRVLYVPGVENFPLVDAFFFVEAPRRTMVGLQTTTAKARHVASSTVRHFNDQLAGFFNGWEAFAADLSWEIIYVQHAGSTPAAGWKRCDVVEPLTEAQRGAEEAAAGFWNQHVRQYRVVVSGADVRAARGQEGEAVEIPARVLWAMAFPGVQMRL